MGTYKFVSFCMLFHRSVVFTQLSINCSYSVTDRGCYFQVENSLKLGMSIPTAYRIALGTWASWVEKMINTNRTRVFFRTFEPSHWRFALCCFNYFIISNLLSLWHDCLKVALPRISPPF